MARSTRIMAMAGNAFQCDALYDGAIGCSTLTDRHLQELEFRLQHLRSQAMESIEAKLRDASSEFLYKEQHPESAAATLDDSRHLDALPSSVLQPKPRHPEPMALVEDPLMANLDALPSTSSSAPSAYIHAGTKELVQVKSNMSSTSSSSSDVSGALAVLDPTRYLVAILAVLSFLFAIF